MRWIEFHEMTVYINIPYVFLGSGGNLYGFFFTRKTYLPFGMIL